MQKILLLLVSVLLVAGCVNDGTSAGLVGSVLAGNDAPEVVEDPTLPIGLVLPVGDPATASVLEVVVTDAKIVKSYEADGKKIEPFEGKAFIIIDVEITQRGSHDIPAGRSRLFVTDQDMIDRYPSSYAGKDGLVGLEVLKGGKTISGKAAFEIPEGLKNPLIVYEFGADITVTNMVAWELS